MAKHERTKKQGRIQGPQFEDGWQGQFLKTNIVMDVQTDRLRNV